jgi:hypothetical protein
LALIGGRLAVDSSAETLNGFESGVEGIELDRLVGGGNIFDDGFVDAGGAAVNINGVPPGAAVAPKLNVFDCGAPKANRVGGPAPNVGGAAVAEDPKAKPLVGAAVVTAVGWLALMVGFAGDPKVNGGDVAPNPGKVVDGAVAPNGVLAPKLGMALVLLTELIDGVANLVVLSPPNPNALLLGVVVVTAGWKWKPDDDDDELPNRDGIGVVIGAAVVVVEGISKGWLLGNAIPPPIVVEGTGPERELVLEAGVNVGKPNAGVVVVAVVVEASEVREGAELTDPNWNGAGLSTTAAVVGAVVVALPNIPNGIVADALSGAVTLTAVVSVVEDGLVVLVATVLMGDPEEVNENSGALLVPIVNRLFVVVAGVLVVTPKRGALVVVVEPKSGTLDGALVVVEAKRGATDVGVVVVVVVVEPKRSAADDVVIVEPNRGVTDGMLVVEPNWGLTEGALVVEPNWAPIEDALVVEPNWALIEGDALLVEPNRGMDKGAFVVTTGGFGRRFSFVVTTSAGSIGEIVVGVLSCSTITSGIFGAVDCDVDFFSTGDGAGGSVVVKRL